MNLTLFYGIHNYGCHLLNIYCTYKHANAYKNLPIKARKNSVIQYFRRSYFYRTLFTRQLPSIAGTFRQSKYPFCETITAIS